MQQWSKERERAREKEKKENSAGRKSSFLPKASVAEESSVFKVCLLFLRREENHCFFPNIYIYGRYLSSRKR